MMSRGAYGKTTGDLEGIEKNWGSKCFQCQKLEKKYYETDDFLADKGNQLTLETNVVLRSSFRRRSIRKPPGSIALVHCYFKRAPLHIGACQSPGTLMMPLPLRDSSWSSFLMR